MRILAIDPGPKMSAYVMFDDGKPVEFLKVENAVLLRLCATKFGAEELAIEMIQSFGMKVGAEVFETVFWVGRFVEAWGGDSYPWRRVYRSEVKMHLCQSMRAKDANIRQVLVDQFGGKEAAIGKKKTPGPLYGMAGDCWSALAVGVTYLEKMRTEVSHAA